MGTFNVEFNVGVPADSQVLYSLPVWNSLPLLINSRGGYFVLYSPSSHVLNVYMSHLILRKFMEMNYDNGGSKTETVKTIENTAGFIKSICSLFRKRGIYAKLATTGTK